MTVMLIVEIRLPSASVEDIEISISNGGSKGLIGEIGGSSSQSGQSPFKVTRGRISPRARVAIEGAFCFDLFGKPRND